MLSKIIKIDKKEILENGVLQIREVTSVLDDGVELSKIYRRYCLTPIENISNEPQEVKDLCNFLWTDEVKIAYVNSLKTV